MDKVVCSAPTTKAAAKWENDVSLKNETANFWEHELLSREKDKTGLIAFSSLQYHQTRDGGAWQKIVVTLSWSIQVTQALYEQELKRQRSTAYLLLHRRHSTTTHQSALEKACSWNGVAPYMKLPLWEMVMKILCWVSLLQYHLIQWYCWDDPKSTHWLILCLSTY